MKLLILKGFNNYFNRIIKRYEALSDYITNSDSHYDFSDMNFVPNDGVTTTQIIGSTTQQQTGGADPVPLAWEHDGNPDYLIAYETEQVGLATINTIKSRWFIVESVRTRNGQYNLKLKRDSIADFFESLISCPAFIKKGTVRDDNPLIVNDEGITVNQIKSGETLLKDKSGSAWIVGYMAKNAPAATITEQIPDETQIAFETIEDIADELDIDSSDLDAALNQNTDNPSYFVNDNIEFVGWVNKQDSTDLEYKLIAGSQNSLNSITYESFSEISHRTVSDCFAKTTVTNNVPYRGLKNYWKNAINSNLTQIKNSWKTIVGHPLFTKKVFNYLSNLSLNKTLIYKQGKYYIVKVSATEGPLNTGELYYGSAVSTPFSTICQNVINAWNQDHPSTNPRWQLVDLNQGKVFIVYNEIKANFYLEEASITPDIPGITAKMSSTRNAIQNQPYDIFAIPYSNITATDSVDTYDVNGEYAQKIAMALIKGLTNSNVYDIQLLPYCPIPQIASENNIDVSNLTENVDYDWIDYTGLVTRYITVSEDAQGIEVEPGQYEAEATINTNIDPEDFVDWGFSIHYYHQDAPEWSCTGLKTTVGGKIQLKVFGYIEDLRDADEYRVDFWYTYTENTTVHRSIIIYPKSNTFSVSLNYNLVLKDSMKIDSQTDLYRLVSPNYQGSFDFNVAKNGGTVNGFIADCTYKPYTPYIKICPNFAWLYGTNFGDCRGLICGGDFSIGFLQDAWENFQLNNKNYQNIFNREIQNLDVNQSIQRTQQYVSGGLNIVRDTIAGGAGGGIATGSPYGAIAGAAIGGIGYGVDMSLMEKGLQEQRQFSIDKFKMQLGNIQALPYTLTKVGAFNINSKVWPFLEYYTCSEQEKEALKMKIQYEGMTVGIVDVLGNYMDGGYVQADLIRNEAIIEDSHLLDDIYIELTKGVYM